MKKILLDILFVLLGIFFSNSQLFAQSCYESSLVDVKTDMQNADYKRALKRIENIRTYCTDIPQVNVLDSLTAVLKQKSDTVNIPQLAPDILKTNKNLEAEIAKRYNLNLKTDTLKSIVIEYDFNADKKPDQAVVYYFTKQQDKLKNKQIQFMGIAVFLQTKNKAYFWINQLKTPNIFADVKQGLQAFKGFTDDKFEFESKTVSRYVYNTQLKSIEKIK